MIHGAMGMYNIPEKTIYIDKNLKGDEFKKTLVHEMGHAMVYILGLNNASLSMDLEEILVDNFSNMINSAFNLSLKKGRK